MSAALIAAAIALAAELQAGDLVSYTFPDTAQAWCLRVQGTYIGADGLPWVWATSTDDPRRLLRLAAVDLVKGCAR